MAIGLLLTAALSGIIGIVGTTYGPDIGDQLRLGEPLKVVVQHDIGERGHVYALPSIISDSAESIPLADLENTITAHQGVMVSPLHLKILVEGARNSTVTISDIEFRVTKRSRPYDGTLIVAKGQGAEENLKSCVNISSQIPRVAQREDGKDCSESKTPYFGGNRVELKLGEQYALDIEVFAPPESDSAGYYEFEIILHTVVSGEAKDVVVRNGDAPFGISSYALGYSEIFGRLTGDKGGVQKADSVDICDPSCHLVTTK